MVSIYEPNHFIIATVHAYRSSALPVITEKVVGSDTRVKRNATTKPKTSKQHLQSPLSFPGLNSLIITIHETAIKCLPPLVLVGAPLEHITLLALPPREQDLEPPEQLMPVVPPFALRTAEKC